MLILRLWNYMRGYVIIRIEGLYLEKFINHCIEKGIYLWDIKRLNYTTLEASIGIKGFKSLRRVSKKAGCKVYLSEKNGYPFWAHKVKKRKMLLLGALFSLVLIITATSFIYNVELVGNYRVEEEKIITYLEEVGLKPGSNRYFIDLRKVENLLMMEFHELAWVGIEIKGMYAKIEIVEKAETPEKLEKDIPCDVVATKSGVIESVIARNGDAIVKKGDIVTEGDLLITGIVSREHLENPMYVHAYGEVYAKTYYEINKSMSLVEIKKHKTGEQYIRRTMKLGQLQLALGGNEVPFSNYVVEKSNKTPALWRNIKLPVEIIVETYDEVVDVEEVIDIQEAKEKIHQEAVLELMDQIPIEGEITNTKVDFNQEGKVLNGKIIIEVIEDIAKQKQIYN